MKVLAFIGFIVACASSFILFQSGNGSWLSEARDVPSTTNRTQEIIWHGSVNSTSIAWDSDDLRIVRSNGQTTSFKMLAQYEFHRLREEHGIKGCAFDYKVRIKSLVGQLMTVEIQRSFMYDFLVGDQKIIGPYSDYRETKTLDVSKAAIGNGGLRELMLTDLFDDADFENALFSERSFQQACQSSEIDCRKGGLRAY